jgi:hypothetical protein
MQNPSLPYLVKLNSMKGSKSNGSNTEEDMNVKAAATFDFWLALK